MKPAINSESFSTDSCFEHRNNPSGADEFEEESLNFAELQNNQEKNDGANNDEKRNQKDKKGRFNWN